MPTRFDDASVVDHGAALVALNDEGTRTAAVRTARDAEAEPFFGGLGPTDRADLARILRTLRG